MDHRPIEIQSIWQNRWIRSRNGTIAGVCAGLGERFGIEPWILRLLWLFSVFVLGFGLLMYLIFAVTLPREDKLAQANKSKVFGVCLRISQLLPIDVGVVRAMMLLSVFSSLGVTILVYVVLYFIIPKRLAFT